MDAPAQISAPALIPEARRPAPLLPPALVGPAAVLWLWALPISVMLLLNVQGYRLIEGNMDAAQRSRALVLGISGLANVLLGLAIYAISRRRRTDPNSAFSRVPEWTLSVATIAVQIAYLWLATGSADRVLPTSVTTWIYPPERFFFNQFSFAMLPLFLGVLRLACVQPPRATGKAIALNLALAVGAPIALYTMVNVFAAIDTGHEAMWVVFASGVVLLSVVMFFGIVRALMLVLRLAQRWGSTGERVAIVLCALVLPVCGLLLNRTIAFPVDFQAWEVYALVIANTAVLLLASWKHAIWPRISFCLLCATFPFSLYFFVVFLPYTPLSILAIIVVGTGFLVLAPTFLFTLHLHLLNKARRNPHLPANRTGLVASGLACFLILPAFFTIRGLADKTALNAALDHVFSPGISSKEITYPANLTNLRRALASHRSYKDGIYYPLLSDYYAWLVFDNLVLPDEKLAALETTFFGAPRATGWHDPLRRRDLDFFNARSGVRGRNHMPRAIPPPRTVAVRQLDLRARAIDEHSTTVTFALTLENTYPDSRNGAEYLKALPLPAGVFVNGFRLHIDGTPVPGRLFEKKTALWVYTMIRDSERRDPGLLYYNKPDELELRVFPVNAGKPVTVEIDFLVPAKLDALDVTDASLDPALALASLGRFVGRELAHDAHGSLAAIGSTTAKLPAIDREPYIHLIIDRSENSGFSGDIAAALRTIALKFPRARDARVTLANYNVADIVTPLTPIAEVSRFGEHEREKLLPLGGGFAADLALAHAIRLHRDADLDRPSAHGELPPRPVFVVLSGRSSMQTPSLKIAEAWLDLVPGFELFELRDDGSFITHHEAEPSLATAPLLRMGNSIRPLTREGLVHFDSSGGETTLQFWSPEAAAWRPLENVEEQPSSSLWSRAAALQLRQQDHARHNAEADVGLKSLVRSSRETGILLATTSYIVVENEAQWHTLAQREHTKLGQSAELEFLETPAPPGLVVAIIFALWLAARRWSRRLAARRSFA